MSLPENPSPDTTYKIVSLLEGFPPASINHTEPGSQIVRLNEPVQQWKFEPLGDFVYRLRVGEYPFTGIVGGKVVATTNPAADVKWHFTNRKDQNGYTIEPVDDQSLGWTIPSDFSTNPVIEIKPIVTIPSDPPQFLPSQLFRLR